MKRILLINFLTLVLIIFTLELGARIFKLADFKGSDNIYKGKYQEDINYDVVWQFEMEKGFTQIKPNIKGKVFGKKVFTDSNGFRIPKHDYKYKKEKNSILIVGDSVSFGNGVNEENTFVGLLRKKLSDISIFNASAPGHNMNANHKKILLFNEDFATDKIILIYTLNDILDASKKEKTTANTYADDNFFKKLLINIIKPINHILNSRSIFYLWLKGVILDPSGKNFDYVYKLYQNKEHINYLDDKFTDINNKVNKSLMVIILPYEMQTRENCNSSVTNPQNKVKLLLKNLNIKFIDLTYKFCNENKSNKLFLKFDPMHLSKQGHELVYDNLLLELEK